MSNVIQFPKKKTENDTKARIIDGKLYEPKWYEAKKPDGDRLERLRRSLEKINELMRKVRDGSID